MKEEKKLGVTSSPLVNTRIWAQERMKIASFLAMTTSHMAQGGNVWRLHRNSRHCEEERRGNLPYFFLRLTCYTQVFCATQAQMSLISSMASPSSIRSTNSSFFLVLKCDVFHWDGFRLLRTGLLSDVERPPNPEP